MYTNILFATDLLNEHSHLTEKAANIAKQFNAKL
ncbi:TPA: universal stress protein, partial [Legionella pneumophila subsp. pneumophila]|nr:universal stress protein [Legionella pneumophila subsp. pneumophila]